MLGAVAIVRRGALVRADSRVELRDCFIVGALLMGGGMGAVAWGEQTVPSGIAALLIAMMPVWVADLRPDLLRRAAAARGRRSASAPGMLGVVDPRRPVDRRSRARSIRRASSPCSSRRSPGPPARVFAAHGARLPRDPFVTTGAADALRRARPRAPLAVATGELAGLRPGRGHPRVARSRSSTSSLVGSLVAFTAYAWVLRHAPLPLIATYAFVNPVVAVFLGALDPRRDGDAAPARRRARSSSSASR